MVESTRAVACLVIVAVTLASPATASFFVDPAGNDANDCLSAATACKTIQAAVDKAPDGEEIFIAAGSYAEEVSINNRESLRLIGGAGRELVPPAVPSANRLIALFACRNIVFEELTLKGNGTADFVGGASLSNSIAIEFQRMMVQDLGGGGVVLFAGSDAAIVDSTIERNRFHGLRVDEGSRATVIGTPFSSGTSVFRDNLFTGIIFTGDVVVLGAALFEGNSVAILGEGGDLQTCCGDGQVEIRSNLAGISLRGGHMELRGPVLIEENEQLGLRLNGASGSVGRFTSSRVVVRNNGGPTDGPGVLLTGSHADLFVMDVAGNAGPGVLAQDNSSIRLFDFTATGNGGDGVRVEALSTARLFNPITLSGNGGFDFFCAPNSYGSGQDDGVERLFCPGFGRSPSPTPGGPGT